MLASAPFDDWWHNAYGLDVKIISPPHMVLAAGFFGINFGAVMLMLAFLNRAGDMARRPLQRLFLYVGGMAVCESLLLKMEHISRSDMHSASFYAIVAFGTVGIITALAVASRHRWGCTILTGVYTLFSAALVWILPLFPAEPRMGPVYHPVTHFIPYEFPLLLMLPALATDLILQRTDGQACPLSRPCRRRRLLCRLHRRPVALREFPDVAARAQLVLRHHLHGLQRRRRRPCMRGSSSCRQSRTGGSGVPWPSLPS